MLVLPAAIPVTVPVVLMVAIPVALLVHVPPVGVLDKLVVLPTQTVELPVMADGSGFTVIIVVVIQVVGSEYVIIAVPEATPVTTPVPETTVAILVLPLIHIPPAEPLLRVVVPPLAHMLVIPVMADGFGLTVTMIVRTQPDVDV